MDLMALESYRDANLNVSDISCGGCGSTIVIHGIHRERNFYNEPNYDIVKDMNRDIEYFYCGICSRKFYTTAKIIKIFTMRKS